MEILDISGQCTKHSTVRQNALIEIEVYITIYSFDDLCMLVSNYFERTAEKYSLH